MTAVDEADACARIGRHRLPLRQMHVGHQCEMHAVHQQGLGIRLWLQDQDRAKVHQVLPMEAAIWMI